MCKYTVQINQQLCKYNAQLSNDKDAGRDYKPDIKADVSNNGGKAGASGAKSVAVLYMVILQELLTT